MSEYPSEHNTDEEGLPKTCAELEGGNGVPPKVVAGSEFDNDYDFRKAYVEYAAQCEEINRRLKKVAPLLERGLYSEAIDSAEIHPNVRKWVALLDLPVDQLSARVKRLDLSPAPKLNLRIARQLNKAYAEADGLF